MLKNHNIFYFPMALSYILGFIVLWEWLRPLPIITDTGNIYVFVWFILFCFFLMYIRLVGYIAIPSIFIAMMYGLHTIFFDGHFLREGIATVVWFGEDLARNITFIVGNDLNALSFEFRSFLLFIVLAIISYLIHFWLCHVKRISLFLLVTLIYVTVIDTFTLYDASGAIIRLVIAGFFLMTLLYKMRLEEKEQVKSDYFKGQAWINKLTVIIAAVAIIAYFSPKYAPIWPDPVPMFTSAMGGEGVGVGTPVRTIGYGYNDEQLGGGFTHDDTVVFRARAKEGHYWRGESKEVYTGRGWQSVDPQLNRTFRYSDYYDNKVAVQMYDLSVAQETNEATITMVNDHRYWHLFYPGELSKVDRDGIVFYSGEEDSQFLIDYVSGKVGTTTDDGKPLFLKEYALTYQSPKFSVGQLKNSSNNDPEHIQEVYLQLPELPERIGELAVEITGQHDNRYDKVKAIEGYFSRNGFLYETTEVAVPAEGQDYVDQFLFETKQGYCDNFSTSMVVMLRTLDIPARWVKGFTQGVQTGRFGTYNEYEISNANAHSWVEVYFPEVGWVPFEPTKGFNSSFEFIEDQQEIDLIGNNEENQRENIDRPQIDPENPFLPLEDGVDLEGGYEPSGGLTTEENLKTFKFPYEVFWIILVVTFVGFLIYKNHQKLLTLFFLYVFKLKSNEEDHFIRAYERLLWLLQLNGYRRDPDETLREYAKRIDERLSTSDMSVLTLRYEKLYYGNAKVDHSWRENKAQWEVLVKKLSS
ncbi:DUF4129 domain-containing protein [Anaerobacillus alkaliphilus]|uniref:DUF4129 domain-containing protein n=1 Tax=Anaerobacillus alkaliphilus TaxID=1548597 RepID=A0A4Q0VTK5_9BACI|nr:transglutaminaseTgpA domain-containing protein [Anaerobacillus alkaliphilus]RXJ01359.1 DUF4129 domain-containing protein [Anaerobacillus alkaliphilus]